MGLTSRNKSGRLIGGSRLNVPGQGIYTVIRQPNDKDPIKTQSKEGHSRPKPTPDSTLTPTPTVTPTITPTPTLTPTPTVTPTITPTSTLTPTPSLTPTSTLTPTPTPTPSVEICYLATEDLIIISAENGDYLIVDCP